MPSGRVVFKTMSLTYKKIVLLSGAGLSAESGLGTFRDKDGLWSKFDLNEVATPEAFQRNPVKVLDFYNLRRNAQKDAEPNAAHLALARLEKEFPGEVITVTQNIDRLHEKAGCENLIHMHGEIFTARCAHCAHTHACEDDLSTELECPGCNNSGGLRPDVVWFGEMPYSMDVIYQHLTDCDLFISIGTSGTVYPAAGFVSEARGAGAHTVELNLEPSEGHSLFHDGRYGPATEVVPAYVEALLAGE